MNRSESIANLASGLAAAQAAIRGAVKDSKNPFFNSKYADLAAVWEACRGPLSANGLSVVQLPAYREGVVTVTTCLMHKSGEFISDELATPIKEHSPQAIGSAITYLRRYALAAVAGVAPEDDDGEAAEGRRHNGKPAAPHISAEDLARIQEANFEEFKKALQEAKDISGLRKAAADIKAAHESKQISDTHRKALLDVFGARSNDLMPSKASA